MEKLASISGYSAEQIEQKEWVGQAKALAPAPPGVPSDDDLRPPGRHNFTVELQLDATSGAVWSSNVRHVQSGDGDSWRGWDRDRLVSFIEVRAETQRRPATDSTARRDLAEPAPAPTDDRVLGPAPVGFTQIRANRLLFPGSGPTTATLRLDASTLAAHDLSATALDVEVYGQRPPFSKSRLLGRARTPLRGEAAVTLDVDLLDPAAESQLEVFAVLTFLDGTDVGKRPVSFEIPDAELTLQPRLSRQPA